MKVHPQPQQNFTPRQAAAPRLSGDPGGCGVGRKVLRRLPHVFSTVLQLPFQSDADVSFEESPDCFRFVAVSDNIRDVRADVIAMNPGLVKVLVREAAAGAVDNNSLVLEDDELELELNAWRVRLPSATRPEWASAVCTGGELVVTVPKRGSGDRSGGDTKMGDLGRLVLVQ